MKKLIVVVLFGFSALLFGCATAPNVHFAKGVTTKSSPIPNEPNRIFLVTRAGGTLVWSAADLERGFLIAARHFCGGREFDHQMTTGTYTYGSPGAFGAVYQHIGYQTSGAVTCKG
jgi:hypothetical protein